MMASHQLTQILASGLLGATTASQFGDASVIALAGATAAVLFAVLRAGLKAMIRSEIKSVVAELQPNGGTNIRDQVDAIVAHLGIKQSSNQGNK